MLRIRLPLPAQMFPDPQDRPTEADLSELEDNPAFLLVVARLQAATYKALSKSSDSETKEEIDALGIIDRTLSEIRAQKEEE